MPTGHSYIFFLSGIHKDCDFSGHGTHFRSHRMQACSYSMRRLWIPAFLFCVPDAHSVSGYPVFSTDAVSVFSFRISSPASPDTRTRSHLHGFLPHILQSHLQSFTQFCVQTFRICPYSLCLRTAIFPLGSADPSQCAVHPVFFTGMIYESSSQDSSVCPHDGTDCIGIDP